MHDCILSLLTFTERPACLLWHPGLVGWCWSRKRITFLPGRQGAPPHYSNRIRATFDFLFPNRWIGKARPIAWPQRSPDTTGFSFVGMYDKTLCIRDKYVRPSTLDDGLLQQLGPLHLICWQERRKSLVIVWMCIGSSIVHTSKSTKHSNYLEPTLLQHTWNHVGKRFIYRTWRNKLN